MADILNEEEGVINTPNAEVKFVKTDPEFIEQLAKKRELKPELVKAMMRYNVFTVNQFSHLSGLSVSYIINKTRPYLRDGGIVFDLDAIYPFQDAEKEGPKFILRNEKSERYLSV